MMTHPSVWAEIDLRAISHNVSELRRITGQEAKLMAVVKANGYGHGAVETANEALKSGAECLGVARIEEGIELRKAGIGVPIMVFGYTPMAFRDKLMAFQLIQSVSTTDYARRLSDIAVAQGSKAKIHIKIDTGMGRLGFQANEEKSVVNEIASIFRMSGLKIEGIFTHFASADAPDKSDTLKQLEHFHDLLNRLSRAGLEFPIRHAANSAALIDVPEAHLDMVRPGIALYGLYPSDDVDKSRIKLVPAMTLKTRVAHIKKVPTGFRVSYGSMFKTNKPTSIATVSIGYADGYNRLLSSKGQMLLHGKRAPVVGRVCMDLTMLDVGHISKVQQDDEVVVFGKQGSGLISADELAAALNTINYEIVTSLTHRVPRLHTH